MSDKLNYRDNPIENGEPATLLDQNGLPRRCNSTGWSPAEHAIYNALAEVEGLGCDPALTRAAVLLSEAKAAVADFVDAAIAANHFEGKRLAAPDDMVRKCYLAGLGYPCSPLPIRTAPRDGTAILLIEGDAIYKGAWDGGARAWRSFCGQPVCMPPEPDHWIPIPCPLNRDE